MRLVGLEAPQIGRRVGAEGDQFDHFHGIWQRELRIEVWTHALRHDAAAPGVTGISQHREADLDLGVGEPFGVARLFAGFGKLVVGGPQAVLVGLADLLHHRFGAVVEPILIDPEETVLGHGIIFDEGPLLGLPCLAGIGEFGRELLLNGGADRLGAADQGIRRLRFGGKGRQRQRRGQKQGKRDTANRPHQCSPSQPIVPDSAETRT